METTKRKPMVIPADSGRKMSVLGIEITLKLAKPETGGDFYVFDSLTPPGSFVPPHVHQHEDELIK
jgi:hypothetical protein